MLTDPWDRFMSSQAPCPGGSKQACHKTSETGHTLWELTSPPPSLGKRGCSQPASDTLLLSSLAVQVMVICVFSFTQGHRRSLQLLRLKQSGPWIWTLLLRRVLQPWCADYTIRVYFNQCHSGEGQESRLRSAEQWPGQAEIPDKVFQEGVPGR